MTNIFTNIDLFRYINEYTDLRSLCDTCLLFTTLKKYIYYKLNREYSLMYYDDILFRTIVLSKIFNPSKQLHLNLSSCDYITDVIVLGNVYYLNLSYCENIINVIADNIYNLDLSYCKNIINVIAKNVHNLNLRKCIKITDVSALGGVHLIKNL